MKKQLSVVMVGCLTFLGLVGQPVKPTISSPANNAVNVALQPDFSIYLNTGLADSFLVEIDSSINFNSVGLKSFKSYYKVCGNCAKLPKIQFSMSQVWYIRSRAWRSGLQGAWSTTNKFSTVSKALPQQNATTHMDFVAVMPEYIYSFSATNVQYEVSDKSDFSTSLIKGQVYPHDSFEGNNYTTLYVRLRGLPQSKMLYMRSRYLLRKDTAGWGPTHTFALKYKPEIINTGGTVNTLAVAMSVNLAIYVYNNYTDTSVFYEYQRASDSLFTSPSSFKTIEYFNTVTLKPGSNFVRYRVIHRGFTSDWSNVVKFVTTTTLPAPILSSMGNVNRTAQANLGPNLTIVQWQADTTTKFNSSRLMTWDSVYTPQNSNRYMSLISDDFAKFRNCYLRYRTGNGTDWMSWSAPSTTLYWQLQGSTQNQNFSLFQQFDFFPMNGVTGYLIQSDVDSTFKSPKSFSVSVSTTSMSVSVNDIFLDNSTLYYRVSARSLKGLSTPRVYKITTTVVPTIWGPGSGQSFEETVPYSIAGKAGSAEMEFQVSKNATFTPLDGTFISSSGGNTGDLPVSAPGDYFFRVRYINARSKGVWSSVVSFKITKVSEMAPPILRSPANGATNVDSKISKFVWNQVPGASQYLISVYENSTGKLLFQNFTDSTWVYVNDLPANMGCKWVVLSMGNQVSKKYSATWKFTTNAMVSVDSYRENRGVSTITLYPNPADQMLRVRITTANPREDIFLFDVLGNQIQNWPLNSTGNGASLGSVNMNLCINRSGEGLDLLMDVSSLSAGVYFLKIGTEQVQFVVSHEPR